MTEGLKKIILIGTFAILFIPLIVTSSLYFPFVTGKNFVFRLLVELMFGAWLLLTFIDKKYRPRFSWLLLTLTAFVATITLSDFLGENSYLSFWGNFGRMEGLITILHLFVYFLIVGSILNTEKLWHCFLSVSVIANAGVLLVSLGQLINLIPIYRDVSEGRLDGTFGNASFLASYLLLNFFLTLYLLWQNRKRTIVRLIYGAIAMISVVVIYFTATRSAIIGLAGGLLIMAILMVALEKKREISRGVAVGVISVTLLFAGLFFVLKNQDLIKDNLVLNRFSQISLQDLKKQNRYQLWLVAWAGVKERPLLGWGQENFYYVFQKHYRPTLYNKNEVYSDRAHNLIFDWLIAGGLFGLFAYLTIIFASLYTLWRSKYQNFSSAERYTLTGFFAAYFINNFFTFDSIATYILFFTALAFIHNRQTRKMTKISSSSIPYIAVWKITAIMILTLIVAYGLNGRPLLTAYNLAAGVKSLPQQPRRSYQSFTRALQQESFGTNEVRRQLAVTAMEPERLNLAEQDLRDDFKKLAESEMKKQLTQPPDDPHVLYLTGSLLHSYGKNEEANLLLKQAKALSPSKQNILLKLAEIHLDQKNYQSAFEIAKETFELAQGFEDVRLIYATTAVYLNDQDLVQELLLPRFGTVIIDDSNLLRAYVETNQIQKTIEVWKLRLVKDPQNLQSYASLSAGYFMLGQRDKAIEIIQQAIRINPKFKTLGEKWLEQIKKGLQPDLN